MSDAAPHQLNAQEMAELSALADGSLPAERRATVEARVAASPELRRLLARQRRAVEAARIAATEPPPESLRDAIAARLGGPDTRRIRARRMAPRLALGGAVAAAAAVVLAVALSGGPAGPSVADAARLAAQPAPGPPPAPLNHSRTKLAVAVDGAAFPDLRQSYGWGAVGERQDRIDGRNATVVTYAKGNRRIGYVIVGGSGLERPSNAAATTRHGVEYQTVRVDGRPAVTWRRVGHTCVLTGSTSRAELLRLAAWHGGGALRY